MKASKVIFSIFVIFVIVLSTSCSRSNSPTTSNVNTGSINNTQTSEIEKNKKSFMPQKKVKPTEKIKNIESGLSVVEMNDEDYFDEFLKQGGAKSDQGIIDSLMQYVSYNGADIKLKQSGFACSTISVKDQDGNEIFGRNFDWEKCNALIVVANPKDAYRSVSTVNTDFITQGTNMSFSHIPESMAKVIAMYAPLDGMNEKGLAVSINMIEDSDTIDQNTDKPDITTTTAVRLLLNKASTVDEAIELLQQYDMHASMGWMIHFAISDGTGKSVAVEYIDNKMKVTDTNVLTNFYITQGDKFGIGSSESHTRYDILTKDLKSQTTMDMNQVAEELDKVSKHNFKTSETTEWSAVFNKTKYTVNYYHRENFDKGYEIKLNH